MNDHDQSSHHEVSQTRQSELAALLEKRTQTGAVAFSDITLDTIDELDWLMQHHASSEQPLLYQGKENDHEPESTSDIPHRIGEDLTDYTNINIHVEGVAEGGPGYVAMGPDSMDNNQWQAIKFLRPHIVNHPGVRDLFIREALTWRSIWYHQNVLMAQFVTLINGAPCIVLDYALHGSLRDQLGRKPSFSQRLLWLQQITAGLVHLHTPDPVTLRPEPIIHRDLKPENILILEDARAVVTDFGLARTLDAISLEEEPTDVVVHPTHTAVFRTPKGRAMGTAPYMAPEQWEDMASTGTPADMYAFGIIFGEMLIGAHPLLDLNVLHDANEWRKAHVAGQRRTLPDVIPETGHRLYEGLLEPQPKHRPTASETLTELQALAGQLNTTVYHLWEFYPHTPERERIFWQGCANAFFRFKYYDEAFERIEKAYSIAPDNWRILVNRGNILRGMTQFPSALEMYDAALPLIPEADPVAIKVVLNQKAILYRHLERYAEAEMLYEELLQSMPDAADAWFNRAVNMFEWSEQIANEGRIQTALEYGRRALAFAQTAYQSGLATPTVESLIADIQQHIKQLN